MTTIYLIWPHEIDLAFRARYLTVTGEEIQQSPSDDGARYMVGSSRITHEHIFQLEQEFPGVSFTDKIPSDFLEPENSTE